MGIKNLFGVVDMFKKAGLGWKLYGMYKEADMSKLKSRKFWVTVVTGALVVVGEQLGIDPEHVQWLIAMASAYVLGQGIADHGNGKPKVEG